MSLLRHLLPHFRKHRHLFGLGVLALVATNYLQQYLPLLLKRALDELQTAGAGEAAASAALKGVLLWAGLRLGLVALQGGLRWGWRMGFFGMSRKVEYGMRRELFGRLLSLPGSFFRRLRLGDLLSRAMSDLAAVRESLGFGWLALIDGVTNAGFTAWFMVKADAGLALQVLAPMALVPPLVAWLGRKVRDRQRAAQEQLDALSQAATESFSGARVIHAYARQEAELGRFERACRDYRARNLKLIKLEALYWPLLWLLAGAAELLLFTAGGRKVAEGSLSVGGFAMFQDYLAQILWPVMALGVSSNQFIKGRVSLARLNEVYDAEPEPGGEPGAREAEPGEAAGAPLLELRGVRFAYAGGPEILRGLDLKLGAGEWVGLASRLGGGKSSLLKLPLRLEQAGAGSILFRGRELKDWPLAALRRRMALVAQEPFLFSETVLENIAFSHPGEPGGLEARAEAAARAADLWETVAGLPLREGTLLGEKGVNLSGGQKQRLALARALFADPELLLLDDAFSAVDTATEERIVGALRRALPQAGVLMVSHRASTLKLCDRVLVLEEGRVAEQGSPAELLARGGLYAAMAAREQLALSAGLEA